MALVFYQPLPVGNKYVQFVSRTNPNLVYTQQAYVENPLVLTTTIPSELTEEDVTLSEFAYCCVLSENSVTCQWTSSVSNNVDLHWSLLSTCASNRKG